MASHRQITVNNRNAQYSSGPKTDEGKRVSRMNALKHGMRSDLVVLPYEDEVEYQELRAQLIDGYAPANNQELMLVDQIAASYWRTMRARAYEREMLDGQVRTRKIDAGVPPTINCAKDDLATTVVLVKEKPQKFETYFRYDASIERAYYRGIAALEKLQSRRTRQERQDRRKSTEAPLTITASPSSPVY
jgi:hypothetical protein